MNNVAMNPATGEIRVLTPAGAWEPAQRAKNPQTGAELFFDGAAWRDVPRMQPARQPDALERAIGVDAPTAGRRLALGARDVVEGLATIPNTLLGVPQALRNLGMSALGMPTEPTYAERMSQALDATGLPQPANPSERAVSAVNRSVAGNLPLFATGAALQGANMAPRLAEMLVGNLPAQVGGAVGAGYAGNAAAEGGASQIGQLGAALIGGVGGAGGVQALQAGGRTLAGAVQPFREGGRQQIAADILMRSAADPDGLAGRIQQGLDDTGRRLPDSPVTTGQASRDPGIMLLESGMRSQSAPNTPLGRSPAVAIRDVEARRNASRLAEILMRQDSSNPEARGATIRSGLGAADDAMGERVDLAFNVARDRNPGRVPVNDILAAARQATRMFDPEQGGGGVPPALQSVVDDIANLERLSFDQAQNIRSRLGDIAGKARIDGDNRLAGAAGRISGALEGAVDDPRWMQAVALRREQGQAMGRTEGGVTATGDIMRPAAYGTFRMPDASIPNRALRSPADARQTMEAFYKALDDARRARVPPEQIEALRGQMMQARAALRGQFMDDMFRAAATTGDIADSAGNVSQALSPASFRRFFTQNADVAREIFEPGQVRALERLAADFAETSMATRTTAAAGSPTAQNLSVANLIARGSNGLIDPGMPLAQTLGSLGGVMRFVYAAPEAATRELLLRAVVDPQFTQLLLARATPQSVQQAARYIETNMAERLSQAATNAGQRAATRAAIAEETRPLPR